MEGTFWGSYDSKIKHYETLINEGHVEYEKDLNEYILQCIPYIKKYQESDANIGIGEREVDPIFNTVSNKGIKRREIYEDYMRTVENYTGAFKRPVITAKEQKARSNKIVIEKCKACGSEKLYTDEVASDTICMECGVCFPAELQCLNYAEEQEVNEKFVPVCGYKKENHLNEWILQFQGRETTTIPPEVLDQLRSEFKKEKIKSVNEISREKVKMYLKKLKLSKYYEHSTHITHLLNGLKPPEMSRELEDRLRLMFREIQTPFDKHCPKNRNNFLSYSYVLYKFCELLGEDEYLPFFPLLKSKDKLRQQDTIWKNICKELQWEYIATI
jgi:hypothetical protein